jgi:hypothetical protein
MSSIAHLESRTVRKTVKPTSTVISERMFKTTSDFHKRYLSEKRLVMGKDKTLKK